MIISGLLSDLVKGSQMILERNGETNFQEKQNFFDISKKSNLKYLNKKYLINSQQATGLSLDLI